MEGCSAVEAAHALALSDSLPPPPFSIQPAASSSGRALERGRRSVCEDRPSVCAALGRTPAALGAPAAKRAQGVRACQCAEDKPRTRSEAFCMVDRGRGGKGGTRGGGATPSSRAHEGFGARAEKEIVSAVGEMPQRAAAVDLQGPSSAGSSTTRRVGWRLAALSTPPAVSGGDSRLSRRQTPRRPLEAQQQQRARAAGCLRAAVRERCGRVGGPGSSPSRPSRR